MPGQQPIKAHQLLKPTIRVSQHQILQPIAKPSRYLAFQPVITQPWTISTRGQQNLSFLWIPSSGESLTPRIQPFQAAQKATRVFR